MKLHVLPGDSLAGEFPKTNIPGEVAVCRECLIVGDVDADILPDFWEQRARFILAEYAGDEIEYHENVAEEFAKLMDLSEGDEVNLWFEYELFCSVNMWFCLWLLQDTEAAVFRVEPIVLSVEDRWKGFGGLDALELRKCFKARSEFTSDDLDLGAALWNAFRKGDHARLSELSSLESDRFPYLKEVIAAEIEKDRKPKQILSEIVAGGTTEFAEVFPEFVRRAGVYGFGDSQVRQIMESA